MNTRPLNEFSISDQNGCSNKPYPPFGARPPIYLAHIREYPLFSMHIVNDIRLTTRYFDFMKSKNFCFEIWLINRKNLCCIHHATLICGRGDETKTGRQSSNASCSGQELDYCLVLFVRQEATCSPVGWSIFPLEEELVELGLHWASEIRPEVTDDWQW